MRVPFSYLNDQFKNPTPILNGIKDLVKSGDFTLGEPMVEFENKIAKLLKVKYAIGVASGTDSLFLSLKAIGVKEGDEVITAANTFYATAGAIVAAGAKPVFVDTDESFNIDAEKIEKAVSKKTRAFMPVHFMGLPANLPPILKIAQKHRIPVIEDSCQAFGGSIGKKHVGTIGLAGGFSFHPLKNLNVWGDAGMVVTNSKEIRDKIIMLRNHGMRNRDEIECYGYNSRLDPLQAVVGLHLLKSFNEINRVKHRNAEIYNSAFAQMPDEITLPLKRPGFNHTYHLYMMLVKDRDNLLKYLIKNGISAKVHYPIPLHLQRANRQYGYRKGDFPVCENQCDHYLTLPVHQHLSEKQIHYTVDKVRAFYSGE